jgi:hypothetical protein
MMRFRTFHDRFLAPTCILNTLINAFFMLVQFSASSVNYDRPGMTPSGFLTCLIFSALVVAAGQIFYTTLNLAAKVAAHCGLSTLSFLILFVFLGSYYADRTLTVLIIAFAFIFCYFVLATPLLILYTKRRKQKNDSKTYISIFDKSAK